MNILSKLDIILMAALAMIGAGVYLLQGAGLALSTTGSLLLILGLLMAKGGNDGTV